MASLYIIIEDFDIYVIFSTHLHWDSTTRERVIVYPAAAVLRKAK